jgi:ubiquinone/menaquinone biosynthesis C-methylase UbiE
VNYMTSQSERAHGVTPGLSQDYAARTADQQAAFVLPYLREGMDLLDVGCGPGTITFGLAQAVAPGQVTGIDHDSVHIEAARALVTEQGATNATFQIGDALALPFEDNRFDAAFENDLLTHLSHDAVRAAREVHRVLKPGGLFAARDVDADAVVWGNLSDALKRLDKLFIAWHDSRGSDITLGKRLPAILRAAGFINTIKSVSADTKGNLEETRAHARVTAFLLGGPFGRDIVNNGWADGSTLEWLKESIHEWGEHPDAFFANVHVEVIGWKPGQNQFPAVCAGKDL